MDRDAITERGEDVHHWHPSIVMAVLVSAIYVLLSAPKTWMPGTSPGTTNIICFRGT
jgi:hypothetical protein